MQPSYQQVEAQEAQEAPQRPGAPQGVHLGPEARQGLEDQEEDQGVQEDQEVHQEADQEADQEVLRQEDHHQGDLRRPYLE